MSDAPDSLEGTMLPDFNLDSTEGKKVSAQDLRGSWIVLYFYPKDDTPGCTKEACTFTASLGQFQKLNGKVYGVSMDSIESHQKFIEKYGLKFPLLADTKAELSTALGTYVDKNLLGRLMKMVARDTFLVDPQGKIVKVWRKVNPEETVNVAFAELKA
ncbi:MAG: peroxiredoxin, partial [Spirochaetia bacterium]|nr:peroxiredoxin [Spirochaetia bacterium]